MSTIDHPKHAPVAVTPTQPTFTWPRAISPLRIALLGWARLSAQAREGSGYNLNKSDLARGLALSGHSVFYLSSGMTYRLGRFSLRAGAPHIAPREVWGEAPHAITCFEIRNAPNLSPAAMNFRNMAEEMESPITTRLVLAWLKEINADVVHIHSLEGFGLDVIAAIEASGVPVVVTPHNYWYACPQVDLLYQEREVCEDYQGGNRCTSCLEGKDVSKLKNLRATGQSLERRLGLYPADVIRKMSYGARPFLKAIARGTFSRNYNPSVSSQGTAALNESLAARGHDVRGCTDTSTDTRTTNAQATTDSKLPAPLDYVRAPYDQNERILANGKGGGGGDKHLTVLNQYGHRRRAGLNALASASLVTPPSDYLRKVHVAMGVPEEKTRWVRLGQEHFDRINRRARLSPFYAQRPWHPSTSSRPLRFAFFGTTRPNKGLEVLVRAIPLIEPSLRRRAQFIIRAQGFEIPFRKRLAMYPEVSVWGGYDLDQLMGSGGEYDVGILSHIWLENSPLVLLENLHAGKFVLSSRLGGPVDFITEATSDHSRDGSSKESLGNGLLFPGGDEAALAHAIEQLIAGQITIPSAKEIHELSTPPLRSYPDHIREVMGIYAEVVARKRAASNTNTSPYSSPKPSGKV